MSRAVVFAYHNVGVRCLNVLLDQKIDVALVVTHTDNPEENLWFGSVEKLAHIHRLSVITPDTPNHPSLYEQIKTINPEFIFSFYYRHLIPEQMLQLARYGAYNMHGSLLPQYRGRVPINWAIIHGETRTGATLHRMTAKADAGDIVDQEAVPICLHDTAIDVFQKVTVAAELVLHRSLPRLIDNSAILTPQDLSQGKYYGGRQAKDGQIKWEQSALTLHHFVRALTRPYPGAYAYLKQGRLFLWRTIPGDGSPPFSPPLCEDMVSLCASPTEILLIWKNGDWLRVIDASLEDIPLTPDNFIKHIGENPLGLSSSLTHP